VIRHDVISLEHRNAITNQRRETEDIENATVGRNPLPVDVLVRQLGE
jgi:hypothetical protein